MRVIQPSRGKGHDEKRVRQSWRPVFLWEPLAGSPVERALWIWCIGVPSNGPQVRMRTMGKCMGVPWQVRAKPCVVATTLLLGLVVGGRDAPQARAQDLHAPCVDPTAYTHSVVSISRFFDKARHEG